MKLLTNLRDYDLPVGGGRVIRAKGSLLVPTVLAAQPHIGVLTTAGALTVADAPNPAEDAALAPVHSSGEAEAPAVTTPPPATPPLPKKRRRTR
ncbi:hypothetical protein ABEG18_13055 [Alsobacter sp. KACC 23698]|uniref:Uncharacterized protein n=1 Tax=Alsobacter sp. KACC 23698 TaxID=3149229 RepID=A0AAU7JMX3_9HYPH